jgi:hypothetical protein
MILPCHLYSISVEVYLVMTGTRFSSLLFKFYFHFFILQHIKKATMRDCDAVSAEVLCEISECQSLVCDADPGASATRQADETTRFRDNEVLSTPDIQHK